MDGHKSIFAFDGFLDEFCKKILGSNASSKSNQRYLAWFQRCLEVLDSHSIYETLKMQQFEKLTNADGLYSMRYPNTPKNPRVLYFYVEGSNIILLGSFLEKSTSDYTNAIKTAQKRKDILQQQWPLNDNRRE